MELKQFITTALVDIVQAIDEARKLLGDEHGRSICPVITTAYSHKTKIEFVSSRGLFLQQVEFDVAVSAETSEEIGGKAGISVIGIKASIGSDANQKNTSISRIKFHVPIGLSCKPENNLS